MRDRPLLRSNLDFDDRDVRFALIQAGAQFNRKCDSLTKAGNECFGYSLIFSERSVCSSHATTKELQLNELKIGTVLSQAQSDSLFGDL